jgi:integrase
MHTKITNRLLDSVPMPDDRELFLRDTELKGFGARITPNGSISFFAEGRLRKGKTKRIGLGRYPVMSSDIARDSARETLYKLSIGIDPRREELEKLEAIKGVIARDAVSKVSLSQVIDEYFLSRPIKSENGYRKTLRYTVGDWFARPIREITRSDVEKRYRKIAFQNSHKAQAVKAMRYLSAVLNFAKAERIEGQALLTDNPVDVLRDKQVDRTVKPRSHYIPKHKLGAVVTAIVSECTETARDVLLLELMTGLRDSEAKQVRWSDIDFDNGAVMIPETKNGKPHVFGMSQFVRAMMFHRFETVRHAVWVFPNRSGNGPIGSIRKQLLRVHKKANFVFTHHDLRRTFATLLSDELAISADVIGRLLNHSPKGVTERHYIHGDPRKLSDIYEQLSRLILDATNEPELATSLYPRPEVLLDAKAERDFEVCPERVRS